MASQPRGGVKPHEASIGPFSRALLHAVFLTLLLTAGAFAVQADNLATRLFRSQDLAILLLGAAILLLLSIRRFGLEAPRLAPSWTAIAVAAAVLLAAWAGTWLVFGGYALTRDELLADFDAAFLARGALLAHLPAAWQPFSTALMPRYMLPISPAVGWLSAYLPGNAALRALGLVTIGADWTNPILAAGSVILLHRIGRRLWPDAPRLALVPVLLLASAPQFLAMAMTAYAMPAHLAFNLLWLLCFLRGDRRGDAGALAAGFVATGLHQILFHPLFAAPFIVELWRAGQRRRLAVYLAAYLLIGLFWTCYWQIALAGAGAAGAPDPGGASFLTERVRLLLAAASPTAVPTMILNLARFLSWQNVLLLPLALLAWPAVRRGQGAARPLAAGILLTLLAMTVLLPWQGHGWGYRYLHGCVGSLCLLAGYGWRALADSADAPRLRAALTAATVAGLAIILPWHLLQAHAFVAPYRAAYAAILAAPADLVLVDDSGLVFAEDLVRNAPDLSNRPKILYAAGLTAPQTAGLCRAFRVQRFGRSEGLAFGIQPAASPDPARARLLDGLHCGSPIATPGAATGAAGATESRDHG